MTRIKFTLSIALISLMGNCHSRNAGQGTVAAADSTPTKQQDIVAYTAPAKAAAVDSSGLPKDSLTIRYHQYVDTIRGYRRGDTLVVETDILMNIPPQGIKGVAGTFRLWPKKNSTTLEIPYQIDPGCYFPDRIENAMAMWNRKSRNKIQFVLRTYQDDYVNFVPGSATESYIGMIGRGQSIKVDPTAREGNIAHEIGHLLGLYHEQSRSDRDQYVRISCTNNSNYWNAFKCDPYARQTGSYNFYSIMHYPRTSCMTIINDIYPSTIPGQRDSITISDYGTVKAIYGL